jgi:hypothetical protein
MNPKKGCVVILGGFTEEVTARIEMKHSDNRY